MLGKPSFGEGLRDQIFKGAVEGVECEPKIGPVCRERGRIRPIETKNRARSEGTCPNWDPRNPKSQTFGVNAADLGPQKP